MKHVFGSIEAISDTIYLTTASILGFMLPKTLTYLWMLIMCLSL
jgi:hypothetical protein